ncbi:MAG: S41 family peptidase [Candidatus Yanofskybacteria bacterium]|nr:S41 family peptidase [Candidatus Yanofskybacteria bacterium]
MLTISKKLFIPLLLAVLIAGFIGGIFFERSNGIESNLVKTLINRDLGQPDYIDFSLFWDTWNSLHTKYVDEEKLNTKKLLYGAIQGMVNSIGDPYTVFFEPPESKKFQEEISGSFGGIGIEIGKREGILTVIAPIKDTPAYKAGLEAGDKILRVDNAPTADLSIEEAVNLIRGKRGTPVILTVSSNGADTRDVEIIRDTIKIPTIEWMMLELEGKKVAYLQIFTFNQNVDSEFQKAAQEILKSEAESLIVDFRNNPGGLLDSAINIAGWFLDKDQVVTAEAFRDGSTNEFRSKGNGSLKIYPTVILINSGSASASEIVAGALRDNRGVRLIGEKTFGKGSVQELEKFKDGSSLKVTVAKWLTPNGISISDTGIEPDVKIELPKEKIEKGEFEFELGTPGKDPQLDRALDILTK